MSPEDPLWANFCVVLALSLESLLRQANDQALLGSGLIEKFVATSPDTTVRALKLHDPPLGPFVGEEPPSHLEC